MVRRKIIILLLVCTDMSMTTLRYVIHCNLPTSLRRLVGGLTNMDMTDQLAFYGAYHSHPINQLIHVIFVPVLIFTFMVVVSYAPPIPLPQVMTGAYTRAVLGSDGSVV